MQHHDIESGQPGKPASLRKSGIGVAVIMFALIGAFYLIREHWDHLGQNWPYLLLLLCPLMHLFMHGGHGHGHHGHRPTRSTVRRREPSGKDHDTPS